ncbi:SigE family RNA polymerase sigma factor [Fodinicola feengrottensis]|uniref:SigE family RNA polymerase sigma factor n=2 Tax=Fodinicola feengrottensis TaxID=435914 RepID=A0ABN2FUT2_9ACTN
MRDADMEAYHEYVTARMHRLRRFGYLICGSWHTADDLVSTVLYKLYRQWGKVSALENVDAYVRRMLVRTWLDELRRPWRREFSTKDMPEVSIDDTYEFDSVPDREALMAALAGLPPGRRAVLVLRYFDELSVEETAATLEISAGTVKSQTARALRTLRMRLGESAAVS